MARIESQRLEANHTNTSDWLEYIFLYDSRGRLSRVGYYAMTETITQYGYDDRNNLTSTTLGNGYQMLEVLCDGYRLADGEGRRDLESFLLPLQSDGSLDYTTDSTNDRRVDYTYDVLRPYHQNRERNAARARWNCG